MNSESTKVPPAIGNPLQRARMLTALYLVQEQYGWLNSEAIDRVSERLSLPVGQVRSTASFYSMFKLEPQGGFRIQICEGLSCFLAGGAETVIELLSNLLGIQPGETTADGRFSLEVVQCLAACGSAPAMRVNDELYENMTRLEIEELIGRLKGQEI